MNKNYLIIILCILFTGCAHMHHKINVKHEESDIKPEKRELLRERYTGTYQPFFELTVSNFRKDGWFYSYHPEHISYPEKCILLTKKAPEPHIDRLIYKVDCFDK